MNSHGAKLAGNFVISLSHPSQARNTAGFQSPARFRHLAAAFFARLGDFCAIPEFDNRLAETGTFGRAWFLVERMLR